MDSLKYNYLSDFIVDIQTIGRYSFSLPEVRALFSKKNNTIKQALRYLVLKKKICPVRRNFYVIIPPEYLSQGILPAALFIDDLMRFTDKPYYVALLSAAALHGAAHQQPQEFFVMTVKPALRRVSVRGVVINFVTRHAIDAAFTIQRQTESGFLAVSCPELTALDCVFYSDRIGGMGRVAEIIGELVPQLTKSGLHKLARSECPASGLQRLGFILDRFPEAKNLADALYAAAKRKITRNVPLAPVGGGKVLPQTRWKIAVNIKLEVD